MPRKPTCIVDYIGRNTTDHTITLSIRGQRYEYFLTPQQCDTMEFLCRKVSARKALNFAKSHASRILRMPVTAATTTS